VSDVLSVKVQKTFPHSKCTRGQRNTVAGNTVPTSYTLRGSAHQLLQI